MNAVASPPAPHVTFVLLLAISLLPSWAAPPCESEGSKSR